MRCKSLIDVRLLVGILLVGILPGGAVVAEDMEAELPLGTIGAGTFSNQRLIADAMKGVAAEVSLRGCDEPERFETYVVETPQGEPGQRYWHELWLVYGCDDEISIDIRFQETGLHSALWVID